VCSSDLGPALTITGAALLSVVILPSEHQSAAATQARYSALPDGLARAGISLDTEPGPVITDFPIWFAESTGHTAIALPAEGPTSVADLAAHFDAHLLIVQADNGGPWPEAAIGGDPRSSCFTPVPLTHLGDDPDPLSGVTVFRIACP